MNEGVGGVPNGAGGACIQRHITGTSGNGLRGHYFVYSAKERADAVQVTLEFWPVMARKFKGNRGNALASQIVAKIPGDGISSPALRGHGVAAAKGHSLGEAGSRNVELACIHKDGAGSTVVKDSD